jgi:hypothetical protein
MTKQFKKVAATLVALSALAAGGSALAQAQSNPAPSPAPAAAPEPTGGPDTDSVQSGDQTAPDKPGSGEAAEAPGAEAPGTETAANDDGPGGHADEPGNANADHQFEGAE